MTRTPSHHPEAGSSRAGLEPGVGSASARQDRAAAVRAALAEGDRVRRGLTARLMRLQCEQQGGCTRSCRRQRRCVAADAFERDEA